MCTNCNEITIPTGVDGVDGENAYTVLTSSYTQPAVNTNVTISVSNTGQYSTGWCAIGQLIYVAVGGYYEVVSKTTTTITIKYTASYTTYNQSLTAAAGTVPNSGVVSPGGIVGPTGTAGAPGANGQNGTTILATYNNITGVGTPASLVETTLFTYTMPANTLSTDGSELELFFIIDCTTAANVTFRIKLGSKIFTFFKISSIDDTREIRIKIARTSVTTQVWSLRQDITTVNQPLLVMDTSTVDLSTILNIECSAENTSASTANTLVLKKATVYKYSL